MLLGAMVGLEPTPSPPYSVGAIYLYIVNGVLYPLSYIALFFKYS